MANDYWETPWDEFEQLDRIFNFKVDICCRHSTAKCRVHFTEAENSLSFRWYTIPSLNNGDYVWCNPPYSNPMPWVESAIDAQLNGVGVVMLLNNDPSVRWFAEALTTVSQVIHIIAEQKPNGKYSTGRIAFINGNGEPENTNNRGQVVFVFDPLNVGKRFTDYLTKSELRNIKL